MADASKAQKLASAKKKFKQYKDQKQNVKLNEYVDTNITTPVDSLTSSTNSYIAINDVASNIPQEITSTKLPNYFSSTYNNTHKDPAIFFDTFVPPTNNTNVESIFPNSSNIEVQVARTESDIAHSISEQFYKDIQEGINPNLNRNNIECAFENYLLFPKNEITPDLDSQTMEDPELKPNEIFELHKSADNRNLISDRATQNLMEYLHASNTSPLYEITDSIKDEMLHNNQFHDPPTNLENLQQLSNQTPEIIENSTEFNSSSSITDLEKRNLELASLYEQEKIKTEQLCSTVNELRVKVAHVESGIRQNGESTDEAVSQEIVGLKEELLRQNQIVNILVGEKTELTAALAQFELSNKQKTIENENLQERVKEMLSEIGNLKKEMVIIQNEKNQSENMGKNQTDQYEKIKSEHLALKDEKEELIQDLSEAKEKLKNSNDTIFSLQEQCKNLDNKLSLANIKIQQLTTGESFQVDSQIEKLTQEKFTLEKHIASLNLNLKNITTERDESNQQFQQYAQQLNAQITNLSNKIEVLQQENENLVLQEQNRIRHISELEKQLQNLQNQHVSSVSFASSSNDANLKNLYEESKEHISKLQQEKTLIGENLTKVSNEKEMLLKELEAKNDSLSQLESMVEQLRGNQPDSVKLLATMESDKVAAARAVSQNKELKQQMEGMQEVFMKLNNDKVELTEKLTIEQRSNKDLIEKLQKTEIHLQTLAEAIEIKDRELTQIRNNSQELNKQVLQQEQLNDRLRHYEAQDNSSHALQDELQDAKVTISKLESELNYLKSLRAQRFELQNGVEKNDTEKSETEKSVDVDVNNLKEKLKVLTLQNKELEDKLSNLNIVKDRNDTSQTIISNNKDKNENDELDKEVAMKYLEDKFTRTMKDIANLEDEKQRLEHLVLQLQHETETIGEYVALYQHQRMILKQRAVEKDQQLKQLANDREQMKEKLQKLNQLIQKVVTDGGGEIVEKIQAQTNGQEREMKENPSEEQGLLKESNTTDEIIALLSEIETSNLIQPNDADFHHCANCSGKLITV